MSLPSSKRTGRSSNLELLRIVAMILIIAHHLAFFSNLDYFAMPRINQFISILFLYGGKLGVNLYVLISGYFLVNSKFRTEKVISIVMEVTFYSIVIFVLFTWLDHHPSYVYTRNSILPIIYSAYWFPTCYLVMYCLINPLNLMIHHMDRKMHGRLVVLLIIMFSVIPTLFDTDFVVSNLAWFFLLYLISSYFRLYVKEVRHAWLLGILAVILYILSAAGGFAFFWYGDYADWAYSYSFYFGKQFSLTMLAVGVLLFLFFRCLNTGTSRFINAIGSTTFGIYLIHCNLLLQDPIWIQTFKAADYVGQSDYGWIITKDVGILFIGCCILSWLYIVLLKKWNDRLGMGVYHIFAWIGNHIITPVCRSVGRFFHPQT